jgi:hypothetical protein
MAGFTDPIVSIENWSALSKSAPRDGIISLFETSGNSFPLTLDATLKASERLHIYFTLDASGKIEFFVIPAALDQKTNKSIYSDGLPPIAIGSKQQAITNESNNELVTWINNWCNETMRNAWLMNITQAPQVLVIHTSDFVVGDLHKCYLALKPNTNPGAKNKNTLDLVIENTVTGEFLNVEEPSTSATVGALFADMARPVPPYDNNVGSSTAQSDFGILEGL